MSLSNPTPIRRAAASISVLRVRRFLGSLQADELSIVFSATESSEAQGETSPPDGLAWRLVGKLACAKLLAREVVLGRLCAWDFAIVRGERGILQVIANEDARPVLDRYRIGQIRISVVVEGGHLTASVEADPIQLEIPWYGKAMYYLFPYRRTVVLENLRRVFGRTLSQAAITSLAQAYCTHFCRFLLDFTRLQVMSSAQRSEWVRVENMESPIRAHEQGKGILLLTGHFGNFEAATVAGIRKFPQYRGLFYFIRRSLKPEWFNRIVTWRFRRAGLGTLPKRGSLDTIVDLLGRGAIIVFVFDQHAGRRDGIRVDFFGHPALTFKSLAILALHTGAPVVPAASWREPDGRHVMRFEEPLPLIECEDVSEAIRRNTRAYNETLERLVLRHPEQWIWMHRRWKNI